MDHISGFIGYAGKISADSNWGFSNALMSVA